MRKVAIVGVEGSGKTVMLAGLGELYSHPDPEGYFLCPKNFQTATYVAEKIARMRKGEWPTATAEDVLQGLDWTLRKRLGPGQRPSDVCEVSCLDFAGEVYRLAFGIRQGTAPDELSDEVNSLLTYIRDADDLIVLINLRDIIVQGASDPRVQEAMWITNEILSYALDKRDDGRTPRAAIVLSQADSYAVTIKSCGGPKGVLARYLPHVANNYDWLDVLAASAVDKTVMDDNGNTVPAPDFQPTRLRVIMHWIRTGIGMSVRSRTKFTPRRPPQHQVDYGYGAPQPQPQQPLLAEPPPPTSGIGQFFTLRGRKNRTQYWKFIGVCFLIGFVGGLVTEGLLLPLIILVLFWPSVANTVRRLHDMNRSGWWCLLGFIPAISWIVVIVLGCVPGTDGDNEFGPEP